MTSTPAGTTRARKTTKGKGLVMKRRFSTEGIHPYDEVKWVRKDVVQTDWRTGTINFEQRQVEFPAFWSDNAVTITTTKYFRGKEGSEGRESSLRQLIDRIVDTYVAAGVENKYFASKKDADIFSDELKWLLLNQHFAFNSPVWFNVGTKSPQQVSACQPYDALVSTPNGPVPIGKLVEDNAVGTEVLSAKGVTKIVAVKNNGIKKVIRIHTKAGHQLDVTEDHLVWRSATANSGRFVPAGSLKPNDKIEWHRYVNETTNLTDLDKEITSLDVAGAALAGWLQSDGFVGKYATGTNKSLTIETITINDAELKWVTTALDTVFPDCHRKERSVVTKDTSLDLRRTRLYGAPLKEFVDSWNLLPRGLDMEIPERLFTSPLNVVTAYLRSIFQAEGFVSARVASTMVEVDMVSEKLIRGMQTLLTRYGIFSRVGFKEDKRDTRHGCYTLCIQNKGDRERFAQYIGFIDPIKTEKLNNSLNMNGKAAGEIKRLEIKKIESLNAVPVYDIQTESSEYLSNGLRVHNCFILAVDDTMDAILNWYKEEGLIFKGGSGAGLNLSNIRSSKEFLSSGGNASGPVSFMRGADASAGTIKSGGSTRRAAKMIVLDVDHPDIEEFVETKVREEDKIRALRDAGFDMDLGGKDIVSVQYQNANNSVRVDDTFMRAVQNKDTYPLIARSDGSVIEEVDAAELFTKIAAAAWACADPGIQYKDTINSWHTNPETGPITASNPCFPADVRVVTDAGLVRIGDLVRNALEGEEVRVQTSTLGYTPEEKETVSYTKPAQYMVTGTNPVVKLTFSDGSTLKCTPNHRIATTAGWVEAKNLTQQHKLPARAVRLDRSMASYAFSDRVIESSETSEVLRGTQPSRWNTDLPEKWSEELGHYLGWLTGDGCTTAGNIATIYGNPEDKIIEKEHQKFLENILGRVPKISISANGTSQLRVGRKQFKAFLNALGVKQVTAHYKTIPEAIFTAPEDVVCAYLRGLFDADGTVVSQKSKGTHYVGLGSSSLSLLQNTQELLYSLGILSRIYVRDTNKESGKFHYTTTSGEKRIYTGKAAHDLRITGKDLITFNALVNFKLPNKSKKLKDIVTSVNFYNSERTVNMVTREDEGYELTFNIQEPLNHTYVVGGNKVVANCSEYLSLDNSSCNLASINLLKFYNEETGFDVEAYTSAVETIITAMDISICFGHFPTEKITKTTHDYRQLGIGYSNLGALLMTVGMPYDSEEGRMFAGGITSLMSAAAWRRSSELANIVGPYNGYKQNKTAHINVIERHVQENAHAQTTSKTSQGAYIYNAAATEWNKALTLGKKHGWRNAQTSLLAPTGTISFLMDCDTTGIEPDFSLVKHKKLVGGGSMKIVNQGVERALRNLGYNEHVIETAIEHVAQTGVIIGAPFIKEEHYDVFDCAVGERAISPDGHIHMMAAAQPFLSGSISKTVNIPEESTIEDIERIYMEGWKLGLKAIAVYRDNCKVGQPLSTKEAKQNDIGETNVVPIRRRLPQTRNSKTTKFVIGGIEGYLTTGEYDDGTLGEIFIRVSKQGSTLSGMMDGLAMAVSVGLQYGVPLETFVAKYINSSFDPAGMTTDVDIRIAKSLLDYMFRRLAIEYLTTEIRQGYGIYTIEERTESVENGYNDTPRPAIVETKPSVTSHELDVPMCQTCGTSTYMQRSGSCYACTSCGNTTGCS